MVLFANNCQNDYEEHVIFKCFQKPQILRRENKTLFTGSSILVRFKKSNFKVGGTAIFLGGTGRKIGLNVEKWAFYKSLSRDFSRLSLTDQNTLFYTFSDQIDPLKSQKAPKS